MPGQFVEQRSSSVVKVIVCSMQGGSVRGAKGAENETPYRRRGGGEWRGGIPLPIRLGGLEERRELPQRGPGTKANLVRFICHRTHLVESKINLFIDNYSDTNKPTILRMS